MTTPVMISGSVRSPSTDSALVRAAAPYALIHPQAGDVQVASIRTLPPFDVGSADDAPPGAEPEEPISAADGVLIGTPEYDPGVPGGTRRPSCPGCGQRYRAGHRASLADQRGRSPGGRAQTPRTPDSRRSS